MFSSPQIVALIVLLSLTPAAGSAKRLAGWGNSFYFIQADGQVYSFGKNTQGGLGIDSTTNALFPQPMLNVDYATDISSGDGHACLVDGTAAKCAGGGTYGQLGRGTDNRVASPVLVQVPGMESGVSQVFAGAQFTCAVLIEGGVKCWGYNLYGAIGDNTKVTKYSPVSVIGYETTPVLQAGLGSYQACLLTATGSVVCAGQNLYSQFGASAPAYVLTMSPIWSLDAEIKYVSISCGLTSCCTVSQAGGAYCWGSNSLGQLGVTGLSTTAGVAPVSPSGLETQFVSEAWLKGNAAFFVVGPSRSVRSCGVNAKGALGLGDAENRDATAVFGGGKTNVKEIRGGLGATCVLDEDDVIQCVGDGQFGQLGLGTKENSLVLVDVALPSVEPTPQPTTEAPTVAPSTLAPTVAPSTVAPTAKPTNEPTTATPTTASPTAASPSSSDADADKGEGNNNNDDNNNNSEVPAATIVAPIVVVVVVIALVIVGGAYYVKKRRAAGMVAVGEGGSAASKIGALAPHSHATTAVTGEDDSPPSSRSNSSTKKPSDVMV